MRLGKKGKFNISIAILLCMAFVLNIGATLAAVSYEFKATSIALSEAETESYTEFANMMGVTGTYTYSAGSQNNQLSLNYGFSSEHDIMIEFSAKYTTTSTTHLANDLSLDFVDRDMWCIDMPTFAGLTTKTTNDAGTETESVASKMYYGLTSTSAELKGVMYYLGTLDGSGVLPVISGVTFYTSNNNSYTHIGDILTVTLTPRYHKSSGTYYKPTDEGKTAHQFYSHLLNSSNTTACDNWATYMNSYVNDSTTVDSNIYMIYNAYANDSTALAYPSDFDWTANNFNIVGQGDLTYANTAYRYKVTRTGSEGSYSYSAPTYEAVIAGNKYYGGLGVFVFPSSTLKTVSITLSYGWEKGGTIMGTAKINPIHLKYSNEINIVGTGYYYKQTITRPTYINVLDHIMLTAENGYQEALRNGYKLVVYGLTVTPHITNPDNWTSKAVPNYEINNSSEQSPILVSRKKLTTNAQSIEANVTINNLGTDTIAVDSFTVAGELWYGDYSENQSTFAKTIKGYLPAGCLEYDNTIWKVEYSGNKYTFTRKSAQAYIPSGYGMTVITGISIAAQPYSTESFTTDANGTYAYINDLWCSLVVDLSSVQTSTVSTYSSGSYSGVENVAVGYYSMIPASGSGYIYIRNNTNQNITSVALSGLTLDAVTSNSAPVRDHVNSSTDFGYTLLNCVSQTSSTKQAKTSVSETTTVTIRPNETILLYQITPTRNAVIYDYNISVALSAGEADNKVDLILNTSTGFADIVNASDSHYEFRLKAKTNLSSYLVNSADFVASTTADADGYYYAYYKGVVCKGQFIRALQNMTYVNGLKIDIVEHTEGWDAERYVYNNYSSWGASADKALADWLSVMASIYGEPNRS